MPDKPQNNDSEKPADKSPDETSHPAQGDDIDNLELEPISSQLPSKKSPESIPSKSVPIDHKISGSAAEEKPSEKPSDNKDPKDSENSESTEQSDEERKSPSRMYPSGKEVDLSSKSDETDEPAYSEHRSLKKDPTLSPSPDDTLSDYEDDEQTMKTDDSSENPDPDPDQGNAPDPSSVAGTHDDFDPAETPGEDPLEIKDNFPDENPGKSLNDKKKSGSSLMEKAAIVVFLLLIATGLALYIPQMIPEAQLSNNVVDVADTPIKLDDITIETLDARWSETLHVSSRVRRNVKWTPELKLEISGPGSGALRIIFLDQNKKQRGDTMDIAFSDGKFQASMTSSTEVYCTNGFTSERQLKDLRARGDAWWTIRVLKGSDVKAPSSEFDTVVEMKVPFEIYVSDK